MDPVEKSPKLTGDHSVPKSSDKALTGDEEKINTFSEKILKIDQKLKYSDEEKIIKNSYENAFKELKEVSKKIESFVESEKDSLREELKQCQDDLFSTNNPIKKEV